MPPRRLRKKVTLTDAAQAEAQSTTTVHVSEYRSRHTWDSKFSAKNRGTFAALGRMSRPNQGKMWNATFKKSGGSGDDEEDISGGGGGDAADPAQMLGRANLRFPADSSLVEVQQQVGTHFQWKEPAVLYQLDHHGWEIPISTRPQLANAFEEWELTSGPRTRFKYDALFTEVEGYLSERDSPGQMLRGAGAAWELACRSTHHELLGEGFIESLHLLLICKSFAAVCHAAAAIQMLTQAPDTAARFPPKLVESLERAVRCCFDPPSRAELRPICKGSPAFLARQPVTAMHRMLDQSLPGHRQQSQMLASCHAELTLWRLLLRLAPLLLLLLGRATAASRLLLFERRLQPRAAYANLIARIAERLARRLFPQELRLCGWELKRAQCALAGRVHHLWDPARAQQQRTLGARRRVVVPGVVAKLDDPARGAPEGVERCLLAEHPNGIRDRVALGVDDAAALQVLAALIDVVVPSAPEDTHRLTGPAGGRRTG